MIVPSATYRIQLNSHFTLRHLQEVLPYLHQLGISTIYAAPLTQSEKDSAHGYDVTCPDRINPQIGTRQELAAIAAQLKRYGMNWLQDIVPNHMAFSMNNLRLADVLERGPQSPYSSYFDIDWNHPNPQLNGRIMLPFLGSEPAAAVQNGEIQLCWGQKGACLRYFDACYPLSLPAYPFLLSAVPENQDAAEVQTLRLHLQQLVQQGEGCSLKHWQTIQQKQWGQLYQTPFAKLLLEKIADRINASPSLLMQLLELLFYAPACWKQSERVMNYRRFFNVNSLICLRMEDEAVFQDYHRFLLSLHQEGLIQGFRIDHIDGLYNPQEYLQRLRMAVKEKGYVVAEKILGHNEPLDRNWPLQGTSGYEFLSFTSQLLTNAEGGKQLLQFYRTLVPSTGSYADTVFYKKLQFLYNQMGGELDNLLRLAGQLQLLPPGIDTHKLKQAIGIWMAACPVYRIYPQQLPLPQEAQKLIDQAFVTATPKAPQCEREWQWLQSLFTPSGNAALDEQKIRFLKRWMQFTGPLAAKGIEDTAFYVYCPLIAHNEVGDSPEQLGISIDAFHNHMRSRQQHTPLSLNATSTHDTKRGEDARLRISVLSALATEWKQQVTTWQQLNAPLLQFSEDRRMPSVNDEYFIYQSLIGSFPETGEPSPEFVERTRQLLTKALREAKVETTYAKPDTIYEAACLNFASALLNRQHGFIHAFMPFLKKILSYAAIYSLSQTLIKITAPGIPDIYQGAELWDTSYVDPDNRRTVNFGERWQWLKKIEEKDQAGRKALLQWIAQEQHLGLQKLFLVQQSLLYRKHHPALFTTGDYLPLQVTHSQPILAYARKWRQQWCILLAPLGIAAVQDERSSIVLPGDAPLYWKEWLTGELFTLQEQRLPVKKVLAAFPVALLTAG